MQRLALLLPLLVPARLRRAWPTWQRRRQGRQRCLTATWTLPVATPQQHAPALLLLLTALLLPGRLRLPLLRTQRLPQRRQQQWQTRKRLPRQLAQWQPQHWQRRQRQQQRRWQRQQRQSLQRRCQQ